MPIGSTVQYYAIENFSANRILALGDAFKLLRMTNDGGAITVTIPPFSDVPFRRGVQVSFTQAGTSTLTLVAGVGVTINSPGGLLAASEQFAIITIIQVDPNDSNIWLACGNLA